MAFPTFCCGFECGQLGAVGQHWTAATGFSIDTTIKRNGARSLKCLNVNSGIFISPVPSVTSTNILVGRVYIYFAVLPNVAVDLIIARDTDSIISSVRFESSDSKIYRRYNGSNSATGVSVSTARWYRIDFAFRAHENPRTADVSVDGIELEQGSHAMFGTAYTSFRLFEPTSNSTAEVYYDDFILSFITTDYPFGNGVVRHFVGTSDGTHTATTTTIVKGTIAAPTGGGNVAGSTDVFNWVNGVPLLGGATDNTRLVNHQTNAATLYAEVVFGPAPGVPTPRVPPRAVEVITVDRQASTATGNFITKLNDNGTEDDIVNRGTVAGVVTDRYVRKHYPVAPTGGAWTVVSGAGNFNNIRARFGYSGDATPDQYWRGIMIEAEFAEPKQKIVNTNQAVKRASYY